MNAQEIATVGYQPLPTNIDDLSEDSLRKLVGQTGDSIPASGGGFPRLSINHSTEDDDGNQLPRGFYMVKDKDGKAIFAPKVHYRPFTRTFMYSVWDNENNTYSNQTIQSRNMNDLFYDTSGGLKCGKASPEEMKQISEHSPEYVKQKSIKCVQVLYGLVTVKDGQDAQGQPASVENLPCIWYVRGSSFIRISEWVKAIETSKKFLATVNAELSTVKGKRGGNVYYGANAQTINFGEFSKEDKALLLDFFKAINSFNGTIMESYKNNRKLKEDNDDNVLEARLTNGSDS